MTNYFANYDKLLAFFPEEEQGDLAEMLLHIGDKLDISLEAVAARILGDEVVRRPLRPLRLRSSSPPPGTIIP
jgi:hypothetical protein